MAKPTGVQLAVSLRDHHRCDVQEQALIDRVPHAAAYACLLDAVVPELTAWEPGRIVDMDKGAEVTLTAAVVEPVLTDHVLAPGAREVKVCARAREKV